MMRSYAPKTLAELPASLAALTPESKIVGGGTDFVIRLHSGAVKPDALCYLGHIPELKSSNGQQRAFGERTAMNHPMQGSAADIIKMAMNEVQRRLLAEDFEAQLMIQVHDELDFSVPAGEVERLAAMVKEVMEGVVSLKVPLIADVSWGPTWAEAH